MEHNDKNVDGSDFGLHIDKLKKRKLKKGETKYPTYEFKTIEEIFDALTPKNMNRFFKDFKTGMAVAIHMRELVTTVAKANAEKDGVDVSEVLSKNPIKMSSFTWIDD